MNKHELTALAERVEAAEAEWIPHVGGCCPCQPNMLVEIETLGGSRTIMSSKAVVWRWHSWVSEISDTLPATARVVAYRAAALRSQAQGEGK